MPDASAKGTLHMVCGLPCAGKTTFAKQFEHERRVLRLSPDEWIMAIYGNDVTREIADSIRTPLEHALLDLALRVAALGIDVILENGFWTREEREEYRAEAAAAGVPTELHYLDVPLDELEARLAARNADRPPGVFHIAPAELRQWAEVFEAPGADELEPRVPHS
jgi:predicted kinase